MWMIVGTAKIFFFFRENILFGRTVDNAMYNQVAVERLNSNVCDKKIAVFFLCYCCVMLLTI